MTMVLFRPECLSSPISKGEGFVMSNMEFHGKPIRFFFVLFFVLVFVLF